MTTHANINRLNAWQRNWKSNLLELFLMAAFVASGYTTYAGAYHIFNESAPVALMLTFFFQGGILVRALMLCKFDNN